MVAPGAWLTVPPDCRLRFVTPVGAIGAVTVSEPADVLPIVKVDALTRLISAGVKLSAAAFSVPRLIGRLDELCCNVKLPKKGAVPTVTGAAIFIASATILSVPVVLL